MTVGQRDVELEQLAAVGGLHLPRSLIDGALQPIGVRCIAAVDSAYHPWIGGIDIALAPRPEALVLNERRALVLTEAPPCIGVGDHNMELSADFSRPQVVARPIAGPA